MTDQTYQGKKVTKSRPAKEGDDGYNAGKDQVVIQTEDNPKDRTVARADLKSA